jgi:hypothetical protein
MNSDLFTSAIVIVVIVIILSLLYCSVSLGSEKFSVDVNSNLALVAIQRHSAWKYTTVSRGMPNFRFNVFSDGVIIAVYPGTTLSGTDVISYYKAIPNILSATEVDLFFPEADNIPYSSNPWRLSFVSDKNLTLTYGGRSATIMQF